MLTFREACSRDIPHLRQLEQCVIDAERPYNSSIKEGKTNYFNIHALISGDDSHVVVAESSSAIIATGYAQIRKSKVSLEHEYHAYLGFMFVVPDFRRKGINQEIMDRLIFWSRSKGIQDVYLDVYSQNNTAIKAYERAGFEPSLLEMKLKI